MNMKKLLWLGGALLLSLPQLSFAESHAYNGFYDNPQNNGVIYGQQVGDSFRIMERDYNRDAYQLAQLDGQVKSYRTNRDQSAIALNLGDSISLYQSRNRRVSDFYDSTGNINNMVFSPNNDQIFFVDQLSSSNYQMGTKTLSDGNQTLSSFNDSNRFYPYAWRSDGTVLLINQAKNNNIWHYNPATSQLNSTSYYNPNWISPDGQYIGINGSGQSFPYYRQDGASPYYRNQMQVYDPVSGNDFGAYGSNDYVNRVMSYDNNRILMARYNQQLEPASYYAQSMGTNNVTAVDNIDKAYSDFNYSNGADLYIRANAYILTMDNNNVVQSETPLLLLAQIHIKPTGNRTSNDYQNYHQVIISGDTFNPTTIHVQTNGVVQWQNLDNGPHTVTSFNGLFDSGRMDQSATYSLRFNQPGIYYYYCRIHPEMRGIVYVTN